MSLPTSEPLPPANEDTARPPVARRRRSRRVAIPAGSEAQVALLKDLSHRVTPSFDFFLFTLLAGLALSIAILIDSPAFFVLAALLSPFMAPVAGLAFASILGSPRFVIKMLGAVGVGGLIIFAWGLLTGWLALLWPGLTFTHAADHAVFSWPDIFIVVLGAALTTLTLVRSPQQRPLVTSVAIAYELYLPIGVAGFGLAAHLPGLWPQGAYVFLLHLGLAALTGAVVLALLGLRPLTGFGYALGIGLAAGCLAALIFLNGSGSIPTVRIPGLASGPSLAVSSAQTPGPAQAVLATTPTQSAALNRASATRAVIAPSVTPAPSRTGTNTLVPTETPTFTLTPAPTPVWAYIHSGEGGGAVLRKEPSFKAGWVKSLLNGMLVQILPGDPVVAEGATWVKIHAANDLEGWIVRSLLTTATPSP